MYPAVCAVCLVPSILVFCDVSFRTRKEGIDILAYNSNFAPLPATQDRVAADHVNEKQSASLRQSNGSVLYLNLLQSSKYFRINHSISFSGC